MNYKQVKAIEKANKERWLRVCPTLNENSGIYMLTRFDEENVKYSYVGQAKHILTRLAQHLTGYQHIDISIKKHKLFNPRTNPYGWSVDFVECSEEDLDTQERYYIKQFLAKGYQSRNKTIGGQDKGKTQLGDQDSVNGYYKGLKQGSKKEREFIRTFFTKYLDFKVKEPTNKIKERKANEFSEYLKGDE